MIEPFLQRQLEPVARRLRRYQLLRQWAICWGVGAAGVLLALGFQRIVGIPVGGLMGYWLAAVLLAALYVWRRNAAWQPDYSEIARKIEGQHPDLHSLLLTAIEQRPDPATGQFHFLQERVLEQAIQESRRQTWLEAVPASRFAWAQFAQLASLLLLGFLVLQLPGIRFGGLSGGSTALVQSSGDPKVLVTPGDVLMEKGSPLVILARFEGGLPAEVSLVSRSLLPDPKGSPAERRTALVKSLDDPVFAATLTEVSSDLIYRVAYQGKQTRDFKVTVYEHPRLERANARVTPPSYTRLPEKEIPDTRRVSTVEGSRVAWELLLNKPVRSAVFVSRDLQEYPLVVSTNLARAEFAGYLLLTNQTWDLRLVDRDGRSNKVSAQFVMEALANRRPEIKIASPRGDQKASPIEEVTFQAENSDDFGLLGYGVAYQTPGSPEQRIGVVTNTALNEKRTLAHLLRLEEMKLEAGSLVSWHFWADDVGPDGKPRRTTSDLFFTEVRPFEQIFRKAEGGGEGEPPPPGQQQSEKLLEIQKQVISATFKLQQQSAGSPGGSFAKDANVVKEGQEKALAMAEAAQEEAEDPKVKTVLETVVADMTKAVSKLSQAADGPATQPLAPALDAEQAAYQGLLRFQAREFQVNKSKSKSSGPPSDDATQRQLDQLEMQDEKDRYETQKQAAPQQNPEQREQLQVLNRLKELAQRQKDVNEQLKEIQSALQAAKTETEKEELRRRLKRLKEEEQQMLSDLDELRQRMDRSADPASVAEAKEQLDRTRAEMQRAAEAMDKGQTAQAMAEGARAQQNLQEAKEDFKKKTSNQFAEDLKRMRSEARQLSQKQEEISQQLQETAQPKRRSLTDTAPKDQIAKELASQKSALTNLMQQMKQVSEQSEASEPGLSRNLYDALRQADQNKTQQQLDASAEMLRRGFDSQAGQVSRKARESIDDLKRGVERAAESILGDDTEALRLAKKELEALGGQAEKELADATQSDELAAQNSRGAASQGQTPSTNLMAGRFGQRSTNAPPQGQASTGEPNADGVQPGQSDEQGQQAQSSQPGQKGQAGQKPGQQAQKGEPGKQQAKGGSPGQQGEPGQQPGQPGEKPGEAGQQNSQGQQAQTGKGQQPGQQQGQQPGQQQAQNSQPGATPGQGQGRPAKASDQLSQSQKTQGPNPGRVAQRDGQQGRGGAGGERGNPNRQKRADLLSPVDGEGSKGPLTGEDYSAWADRLRDVEEALDDPTLRAKVAQAREQARVLRNDYKTNAKEPQWELVRSKIIEPLAEVRQKVGEDLARRESKDSMAPIDRDPVPKQFTEQVKRYYERLGSAK